MQEFLDHSLDEVIGLTGSKIGYIYFSINEESKEFVLNSWSNEVMKECAIVNPQTCYKLAKTGFWGEVVRQRKPLVMNQFHAPHPLKKGYPEGHVALRRFMSVPVFDQDRIVAVVGVANKDSDYNETDVLQLTLLMDGIWKSVEIRQAEQRLREATQHYLTVAKCIPDTIWSIDLSFRFTYVSPSIERTHGWTIDECSKLNFLNTVAPRQVEKVELLLKAELKRAVSPKYERNSVITFESEGLRKNGSTFWIEINASFVWSDDGVVGVTGVTRDITERKKEEREQQELMRKLDSRLQEISFLRVLIEQSRDGMCICDQNLKVVECNQMFANMLGYASKEMRQLHVWDWEVQWTREQLLALFPQFETRSLLFETQHRRKDGTVYDAEISVNSNFPGPALCVIRDISARKAAEVTLRESEEKLSKVFHLIPDAVYIVDFETGCYIEVNEGFEAFTGYRREEAIGKSAFDLNLGQTQMIEKSLSSVSARTDAFAITWAGSMIVMGAKFGESFRRT